MRSPASLLDDSIVMLCFLPAVEMNPRTLCACQFVTFMISPRVAPLARPINSRIFAPLLLARGAAALRSDLALDLLVTSFFGAATLAFFLVLGASFLWPAPFFEEALSGATAAPCSATVAAMPVVFVFVMFCLPFLVLLVSIRFITPLS